MVYNFFDKFGLGLAITLSTAPYDPAYLEPSYLTCNLCDCFIYEPAKNSKGSLIN